MDRLRAFEVFVAVVGQGGFTRAADKLDTSPANVTRYVNDLEEALGVRLLNRTSRRLSLTETGKTLYDRALSILEDVAEAEAVTSSSALQPRGRLRVNVPVSFGILHLAPLWPRFMARYPDIQLDISLADRVVDLVEEGYDLAIRISRAGSPSLISRKLATSQNVVCASPDYIARHGAPQAPEDLKVNRGGVLQRPMLRKVSDRARVIATSADHRSGGSIRGMMVTERPLVARTGHWSKH